MTQDVEKLIDALKKRVDLYDVINKAHLEQMKFGLSGQVEYGKIITNLLVFINGSGVASIPFLLNYMNSTGIKIGSYVGFFVAAGIYFFGILMALFLALMAYYNFQNHVNLSVERMNSAWMNIQENILNEECCGVGRDKEAEGQAETSYIVAHTFGWLSLIAFFVATISVYGLISARLG